jgi:hypothetical protein
MRRNPANPSTVTAGMTAATKIPTEVEAAAAAILLEETILSTVVEVEASEMEDPAAVVASEVVIEAATEVVASETATEEAVEATGLVAATMTTHPAEALAALVVATETKAIAMEDIEEAGEVEVVRTSTVAITTAEVYIENSLLYLLWFFIQHLS